MSYFGEFGTPGLGYELAELEAHISRIMGLDERHDVLLVGAGNLGNALIYPIAVPAVCFVLALFLMPETRHISIWETDKAKA